jgi:Domain of unknown function (DUF4259)
MGAWGTRAFDNDTALDWVLGLERHKDLKFVETTIERVAEEEDEDDEYLEEDAAVEALAACEVLARLQGRFGYRTSDTEDADAWAATHPLVPPLALLERAVVAIDRILGKSSALADVWAESTDANKWRQSVTELRDRLLG